MAYHVRRQIRDAFVSAVTGLVQTGSRVEAGRRRTLTAQHLPTLLVYTLDETSGYHAQQRKLMRVVDVAIECRVSSHEPVDDDLDQVALEVERAIANRDFRSDDGLSLIDVQLVASRPDIRADGDLYVGKLRLDYRVEYRTLEQTPDIPA